MAGIERAYARMDVDALGRRLGTNAANAADAAERAGWDVDRARGIVRMGDATARVPRAMVGATDALGTCAEMVTRLDAR
jgi:hypothetical protein